MRDRQCKPTASLPKYASHAGVGPCSPAHLTPGQPVGSEGAPTTAHDNDSRPNTEQYSVSATPHRNCPDSDAESRMLKTTSALNRKVTHACRYSGQNATQKLNCGTDNASPLPACQSTHRMMVFVRAPLHTSRPDNQSEARVRQRSRMAMVTDRMLRICNSGPELSRFGC